MRVLSFETATYSGGVAFIAPGIQDAAGPFEPRGASRKILASADALLKKHACRIEELDLVAVSTGPGLFTGVRVGLSIAKTLVWACPRQKPALAGVSTLEAVASLALLQPQEVQPGDAVIAVADARRGEVYAALFQIETPETASALSLKRGSEDMVVRPDRLKERLFPRSPARKPDAPQIWLAGDGAERYRDLFASVFDHRARFLPEHKPNLALQVAALGTQRFLAGFADDPDTLHPHYVRRPDARPPVIPTG